MCHSCSSFQCAADVKFRLDNSFVNTLPYLNIPFMSFRTFLEYSNSPTIFLEYCCLVLFPIYWYDLLLPPLSLPSVAPHFNMIYILPFPRKNSSHVSYLHLSMPVREKSILMFPCVVGSNILKSSA